MNQAGYLEYMSESQNKWKAEESEVSSHGRRLPTEYKVRKYLKNIVIEEYLRKLRKTTELKNLTSRIAGTNYKEQEKVRIG